MLGTSNHPFYSVSVGCELQGSPCLPLLSTPDVPGDPSGSPAHTLQPWTLSPPPFIPPCSWHLHTQIVIKDMDHTCYQFNIFRCCVLEDKDQIVETFHLGSSLTLATGHASEPFRAPPLALLSGRFSSTTVSRCFSCASLASSTLTSAAFSMSSLVSLTFSVSSHVPSLAYPLCPEPSWLRSLYKWEMLVTLFQWQLNPGILLYVASDIVLELKLAVDFWRQRWEGG